jgi:hypothetical protein
MRFVFDERDLQAKTIQSYASDFRLRKVQGQGCGPINPVVCDGHAPFCSLQFKANLSQENFVATFARTWLH